MKRRRWGPEQLQYLIAEDGQLKLNKESIQQATIAQLEQAKATYIQAQASSKGK